MPHMTVYVTEKHVAGKEDALAKALSESVARAYGPWGPKIVDMKLIPLKNWYLSGTNREEFAIEVELKVLNVALNNGNKREVVAMLVRDMTDAVVQVFGEENRARVGVRIWPVEDGLSGSGGEVGSGINQWLRGAAHPWATQIAGLSPMERAVVANALGDTASQTEYRGI